MTIEFQGRLYRALNPIHAREPLSGEGARLYGGRFNPKGVPALYLSLSVMTALREANQAGSFQPTTLVCYEAEIESLFDSRDEAALRTAVGSHSFGHLWLRLLAVAQASHANAESTQA